MSDLIRREDALEILRLAEHDAEERDWRSGANEIAKLERRINALPAAPDMQAAERERADKLLADAAKMLQDRADYLEDAAKWGGSKQYLARLKGGTIELRSAATAILARTAIRAIVADYAPADLFGGKDG